MAVAIISDAHGVQDLVNLRFGVVAKDVGAHSLSVGEVMGDNLVSVREEKSILDAPRPMPNRGVRRAPATGKEGELVGILAVDDVLEIMADQLREMVWVIG